MRVDGKDIVDMYIKTRTKGFGDEVKRRILLGTYVLSSGYYDAYYLRAMKVRTLIKQDYDEALKKCDVLLTPTAPIRPSKSARTATIRWLCTSATSARSR